jgi:hypothetical protein
MVTMSQKEFQRVKVIENAAGGRLSVREASRLLHLSERQVQRPKRRYQPDSVGWVQHGNRGRSMPWAVSLPQLERCDQCVSGLIVCGREISDRLKDLLRQSIRNLTRRFYAPPHGLTPTHAKETRCGICEIQWC